MYWLLSKYSITPNNWQETQKSFHFHAVHSCWGAWPFVATSSHKGDTPGIPDMFNYSPTPDPVIKILQSYGLQKGP